jgi:hypothetical protein
MQEPPIACSLKDGDLKDRLEQIKAIGTDALLSHKHVQGAHCLRFRAEPDIRQRLEAIVAAEGECCSFLALELEEDSEELTLSIAAPADAGPVAAELAGAFAEGLS